jgi:dihydroxy-acid dehydratase
MTFSPKPWPRRLRSREWFEGTTKDAIYHRAWMKNQGFPPDLFDGRPVIGIMNTWSELTPCNAHLNDLAQRVKHGIYEAGGFPVEVPVFSVSESAFRPTAMMFRNLAAMAVEEQLRGQPIDGAVLMVGCDKTTPSLLMAAASCDLPAIIVSGGPMLNGYYRGETVGSGTHLWKFSEAVRAGQMQASEFVEAEASMSRSPGSCNTMGTASTMASMAEALGMALSGNAAIPAVDSRRRVMAQLTGRRIVQMVKDDLKPSDILTKEAFENAIRTNAAIGGSTNAVIHLLAIAGRVGIDLTLDDWDRCGRDVPTIVNVMPSGKYLMEEFFYAGGLPVVIKRLGEAGLLHRDALTVSGQTIWEQVRDVVNHNPDVILPVERALTRSIAAAPWCSRTSTTTRPGSRTRRSTWTRPACWCSRTAGPRATRAWPRSATWACRPRSCARGSPTWSASRMRGCRGRPTARSCCTPRPRPRRAGRSPLCATAT